MSEQVVVIGAVALGPKAACRFKRISPDSKVIMFDRDKRISYGGCGIPFYVSGEVSELKALQETSFHTMRSPEYFQDLKGVETHVETEVVAIDRKAKTVTTRHLPTGKEDKVPYDKLVIATGASPRKLPIPGIDLPGVHAVNNLDAAEAIKNSVIAGKVGTVAIIGSGFIGLEMAVAFADMWGLEVHVIEIFDQILPGANSPVLSRMAQKHMEEKGVIFHMGDQVKAIEGDGKVERIITDKLTIDCDMVIASVGVVPNDQLAKDCGLEVSERGGIIVDEHMCTSDPNIFAGGDCVLVKNLITEQPMFLPMGSMANRQGRAIGDNLAGIKTSFKGVVGSWCVHLFEMSCSGTGLTLAGAKRAGLDAFSVQVTAPDRAHFYPERGAMSLEIVVENGTRRVLGLQGYGVNGDAVVAKVNSLAAILPYRPTITDISNLEMAYSPPFASAMDILNALANVADNVAQGRCKTVNAVEFEGLWKNDKGDTYILDCRDKIEAEDMVAKFPERWHHFTQKQILAGGNPIPQDKRIVVLCSSGARSYESLLHLTQLGFKDVCFLEGGLAGAEVAGVEF